MLLIVYMHWNCVLPRIPVDGCIRVACFIFILYAINSLRVLKCVLLRICIQETCFISFYMLLYNSLRILVGGCIRAACFIFILYAITGRRLYSGGFFLYAINSLHALKLCSTTYTGRWLYSGGLFHFFLYAINIIYMYVIKTPIKKNSPINDHFSTRDHFFWKNF
jgi:hypothetical protein